uniref:Uncharacterized protein n=1 Tax=Entomoneis paludosa TaxID=265537 RepID=A0A7S2YPC9_9STRA|mmetsp:Transcript_4142/g.8893  ORF Transcript_4142/g.8893 Transcript_4142/m.8893 type:complete len:262 (+) Transcript_4142:997-1782(+)|eukprot:CAMPEP_0172464126 /NCGR_PEP_ID=MMETSP1065-20121228/49459_1 /TAXON_ID=265537 /ORGANISM="Amphiprora paludosa, Strain CCMP125" /LENGTH=261 /DNA_ID=CAMNT_0013220275 /DNA_START=1025 /DNA_END=1810 /DNA_ORIENTATION=-
MTMSKNLSGLAVRAFRRSDASWPSYKSGGAGVDLCGVSGGAKTVIVHKAQRSMTTSSKAELLEAAEALVKAAVSDTESTSLSHGRATVSGLEEISKGISEMKVSSDGKLNTIHQKLFDLDKTLQEMKFLMKEEVDILREDQQLRKLDLEIQNKRHKLEFAMQHADHEEFVYYLSSSRRAESSVSTGLVKDILLAFLRDKGFVLSSDLRLAKKNDYGGLGAYEHFGSEKDFRRKLVRLLESLLGSTLTMVDAGDGNMSIHYL